MNTPKASLQITLGLLALVFTSLPGRADEAKREQPAPATPAPADSSDPKPNPEAKIKPAASDPTSGLSAEELKKAIKKYDANGNGVLDDDELAKMKADQDSKAAKKTNSAADRAELRSTQQINRSIRQSTKAGRKVR